MAPALDWSAWGTEAGGLLGAVEMCNNNGTCRSFDAGSMCPSYRATRDEQHVTRGRANTLRLAITGQLGDGALASDAVHEALKLCVSCKACKRECPTGVDMARMKVEALAARAAVRGVGLRERLVAYLPVYAPWARWVAPLLNLRNRVPVVRRAMERVGRHFGGAVLARLGSALCGPLPRPLPQGEGRRTAPPPLAGGSWGEGASAGPVFLFADTFNAAFEPGNLEAAVRVLRAAGFAPVVPEGLCCGRTYLSAGLVERARAEARKTLAALAGTMPVVGLEPSCLLTLRDEFVALLPGAEAEALAGRAMLLSEFLARHAPGFAPGRLEGVAHVHGHCHQKAHGAFPDALAALGRVGGLEVRAIQSACCGMAGAFGYQAETQVASRAMAELSLLPAVRAAGAEEIVVADGTSCRHQIAELGGRVAVHSVVVLDRALRGGA